MKDLRASSELTQIAMQDAVRHLANALVALSLHDDAYVPIPNLADVLMAELAEGLTARGVPARVAADLLGISRRSFFRYRNRTPELTHSRFGEILALLGERPLTKIEILEQLADLDVSGVESALSFLVDRSIVVMDANTYELVVDHEFDDQRDIEDFVEGLASDHLPLPVEVVARELGQDVQYVRRITNQLAARGRLDLDDDAIVGTSGPVDHKAIDHRSTILGFIFSVRTMFSAIQRRLDGGRDNARVLTWSFSSPALPRLRAVLDDLCGELDSAWEATELDNRTRRSVLTIFAGWVTEPDDQDDSSSPAH